MHFVSVELEFRELALDGVVCRTTSTTSARAAVARVTVGTFTGLAATRFKTVAVTLATFAPSWEKTPRIRACGMSPKIYT